MALVQRRLKRLGVDRALAARAPRPGDDVRIGQLSFTYSERHVMRTAPLRRPRPVGRRGPRVTVVVKIGSSLGDGCRRPRRRRRRRQARRRDRRAVAGGPACRRRHLGRRHGRRRRDRAGGGAADGHDDPAGALDDRPAPPDPRLRRGTRRRGALRRPGAAVTAGFRRPPPVPPRPGDDRPADRTRRGAGHQRERCRRRRRDPLRRQRPSRRSCRQPRRARSASSCSPTPRGSSTPIRGAAPMRRSSSRSSPSTPHSTPSPAAPARRPAAGAWPRSSPPARMAAWCGVRAVIAAASRPGVVVDAVRRVSGVGTTILPRGAAPGPQGVDRVCPPGHGAGHRRRGLPPRPPRAGGEPSAGGRRGDRGAVRARRSDRDRRGGWLGRRQGDHPPALGPGRRVAGQALRGPPR